MIDFTPVEKYAAMPGLEHSRTFTSEKEVF